MNSTDYKSFQYLDNGDVHFSIYNTTKLSKVLLPGFYSLSYDPTYNNPRPILKELNNLEELHDFDYPNEKVVLDLINSFYNPSVKEKINSLGIVHKIGLLYHGSQGTGKTSIIKKYSKQAIINKKALVFFMDCKADHLSATWSFIEEIRKIQNNPIIVIFDEFDRFFKPTSNVDADVKTITDGNRSIDNCIFFACTNKIEDIPKEIKDRPSRFKHVINIEGFNSQNQVKNLIENLLKDVVSEEEIQLMSESLKSKTVDVIKQACIDRIMNIKEYTFVKKTKLGF